MSRNNLERPEILRKAQDEFFESPIQSSGILFGCLVSGIVILGAAWTIRSVLTTYILPIVYWLFLTGLAARMAWKVRHIGREFFGTGLAFLLILATLTGGAGAICGTLVALDQTELRLLALMPTTEEVTAQETEVQNRLASRMLYTGLPLLSAIVQMGIMLFVCKVRIQEIAEMQADSQEPVDGGAA